MLNRTDKYKIPDRPPQKGRETHPESCPKATNQTTRLQRSEQLINVNKNKRSCRNTVEKTTNKS